LWKNQSLIHYALEFIAMMNRLVFARLVTDKATFAYLGDVFILPKHRGKGLSKFLMQTIHAHPELQNLRRWWLGTKDAHRLYEQFGWTRITEDVAKRFMQKHNPNVYKKTFEWLTV
jgi:GNAT superfamily N-acetyltransferase